MDKALRFANQILPQILDSLLSAPVQRRSSMDRFRARSTALTILAGWLVAFVNIVLIEGNQVTDEQLPPAYLHLTLSLAAVLLLKLVHRPQRLAVIYILAVFLNILWFSASGSRSLHDENLYWLPTIIMASFLTLRPRLAFIVSLAMQALYLVVALQLKGQGFRMPSDKSLALYVERMEATLLMTTMTSFFMLAAFLSLTRMTQAAWEREKECQLQSVRLRELSELAANVAALMAQPLLELQVRNRELLDRLLDPTHDTKVLAHMEETLGQLTRISGSFALLAKPKQEEETAEMEASVWLEHMSNIVQLRVQKTFWTLHTHYEPDNLVICGPLGRLSMLIVLCLQKAFALPAPVKNSPLSLTLLGTGSRLLIHISFEKPVLWNGAEDEQDAMSGYLIAELLHSLAATMQEIHEDRVIHLLIEGPWNSFSFRKSA